LVNLEFCDLIARFDDTANDFVSRHHRVNRATPFVARLMDIGMANATIEDVDLHIVGLNVPALETERRKRIGGALYGIGICIVHVKVKSNLFES
jgi:hypothetical protein